jgi:NDP-sugar pyrophosphorylase family protein
MNAIILAAGFGTRFGHKDGVCKPLLSINKKQLLNRAIDGFLDGRISGIHIVHNGKWAKLFRQWKSGLQNSDPGHNTLPYIKLHNDQAQSPEDANGALGSLYFVLQRMKERRDFFLMCADTVCTYPVSDFVKWSMGSGGPILALKRVRNGTDTSRYGSVDVDPDGTVYQFKEKADSPASVIWIGPAYFPASLIDVFFEFYEKNKGDNLGDFFSWLAPVERINTWLPYKGEAFDVGDKDSFRQAELALIHNER